MNLLLALALLVQDDLSEPAKKADAAVSKLESKYRELIGIQEEFAGAQERGDRAGMEALRKRFEERRKEMDVLDIAARKEIEAALKAAPDDADVCLPQARLAILERNFEQAVALLDKFIAKRPEHLEARLLHAQVDHEMERPDLARTHLDAVLAKDPKNLKALVARADVDRLECKYADARKYAAKAVEVDPKSDGGNLIDADAAFQMLDFKAAQDRLEGFLKAYPDMPAGMKKEVERRIADARQYGAWWDEERKIRAAEEKSDDLPRVKFVTSAGDVEIELFENEAPATVANFIALIEKKFYDGTKFHRVLPSFMVQGGDPLSKDADPENDGTGGPGYKFADELPAGKYRRHFRGSLSMANSGPDTNGSQFFVTHVITGWLNGKHTVFGRVLKGQDVIDRIKAGAELKSVEVIRKRAHEYKAPK